VSRQEIKKYEATIRRRGGTPGQDAVGMDAEDVRLGGVKLLFEVDREIHPAENHAFQSLGTCESSIG